MGTTTVARKVVSCEFSSPEGRIEHWKAQDLVGIGPAEMKCLKCVYSEVKSQVQGGGKRTNRRTVLAFILISELRLAYRVSRDLPFDLARPMCSSSKKVMLNPTRSGQRDEERWIMVTRVVVKGNGEVMLLTDNLGKGCLHVKHSRVRNALLHGGSSGPQTFSLGPV